MKSSLKNVIIERLLSIIGPKNRNIPWAGPTRIGIILAAIDKH